MKSKVEDKTINKNENKLHQLRIENINLENVSFAYGNKKILENINLIIKETNL